MALLMSKQVLNGCVWRKAVRCETQKPYKSFDLHHISSFNPI